ncbi:MAG: hypothetical protein AAF573_18795 [Bacteroidota bacterium]
MAQITHADKNVYPVREETITTQPSFWEKLTNWESYPKNVFLLPLYCYAIGKAIVNRTMWLPSTSNPRLTFGSFFGLKKSEVYGILPAGTYPNTILIHPSNSFNEILGKIENSELDYPFIVKPDVGMVGLLVRVIENEKQLRAYHQKVQADWIIQEFVAYDVEVGLFYVRHPEEAKGRIVGLSEKKPLSVIGDGISTIEKLVKYNERTAKYEEAIYQKQKKHWHRVPAKGEFIQLIQTGNRKNGARLVELVDEVDEDLVAIFDEISHHSNQIFYGRYDIKCTSLEDLKKGKNFAILEFNGVHSGYGHLYHCGKSAREAYTTIYKLWKELFDICMTNHQKGEAFMPFGKGWKSVYQTVQHFRKLKQWEKQLP